MYITWSQFLGQSFGKAVYSAFGSRVGNFHTGTYISPYRRNIDIAELEGGYKTITHNGIPVVADRFVDEDTMYLLNTNDFTLHQLCDWKWLEGEDGRVIKQVADKPVYKATLVKYADLICSRPCGQAMLKGITEA